MMQIPAGSKQLTADEVCEAIIAGDHPEADLGDLALDNDLIDLIRLGWVVAVRLADGRLAFARLVD